MPTTEDLLNAVRLQLPPQRPPNVGITIKEFSKSMNCTDRMSARFLKEESGLIGVMMVEGKRKLVFITQQEVDENEHYKYWVSE